MSYTPFATADSHFEDTICTVSGANRARVRANANLIAAAPALVDVIKEYLAWGAKTGSDRDLFDDKFGVALALAERGA